MTDTTTGYCPLCPANIPTVDILNHPRLMHPDVYDEPDHWPDGDLVVVDTTLTPGDFRS